MSSDRELRQIFVDLARAIDDVSSRAITDEEDAANRAWLAQKHGDNLLPPLPERILVLKCAVEFNRYDAHRVLDGPPEPVMIGRFEAIDFIARGSYGVVFLALDLELDRKVALKMCPQFHPDAVDMFRREAKVLAGFRHENIVTVYDIGEHDGDLFYVMEYLPGGDGQSLINTWRHWEEVVRFFLAAAAGLAAAHKSVVHGDFKLKNILRGQNGEVRVADFGLGRLIDNGTPEDDPQAESHRMGTFQYMPPEVLRGQPCDALGDQWSFGVALWAVLFAVLPFAGETAADVLASIATGEPNAGKSERPVPEQLRDLALRCMSVDRSQRFADMHEVIAALRELLRPPPKPPVVPGGSTWGPILLAFLLGGGVVLGVVGWPDVGQQPEPAERAPDELPLPPDQLKASSVERPCALSALDGDPSTINPVVVAVCVHIRRGELDKAQSLWVRERDARKLDRAARVSARVDELEAQQRMDEAELASAAATIESELAYALALDTVIVARTFADQAKLDGPNGLAAATHANDWAVEAAATLGVQAPEITDIRDRIGRLALPQALDLPTLHEDAPLAVE